MSRLEEFYSRYEHPEVEDLVVGYSGIDPPRKVKANELNHEELANLLGGDETGHYHLTGQQYSRLLELLVWPPVIEAGQEVPATADEEMTDYEIRGTDIRRTA